MKKFLATLGAGAFLAIGVTALPMNAQPAQAASYTSCYVAMNGSTWCYRYACTAREEMAGCYEGWVRRNVWAA
ncbi:hypothetical protein ACIPY0_12360 [Paenarthrobacter nicotinovorans]|uniref:hypothetical protein n=1 Tax=Paenarthrobacter nicotinovorans TaxID=29320 RepID=UPI00381B2950